MCQKLLLRLRKSFRNRFYYFIQFLICFVVGCPKLETHNSSQPECTICKRKFRSYSKLTAHYLICYQRTLNFLCSEPFCKQAFKTQVGLHQHIIEKHSTVVCCLICLKIFSSQSGLETHQQRKHSDKFCSICSLCFKTDWALESHQKMHVDDNFQCVLCRGHYASKRSLQKHVHQCHTATFQMLINTDEPPQ